MTPPSRLTFVTVAHSWAALFKSNLVGDDNMGDFFAAMLVMVALAAVGNFATGQSAMSTSCAGKFVQVCW